MNQAVPPPGAIVASAVADSDPTPARNRVAVWGFVLALVSLVPWFLNPYLSIDIAVAAVVLGIIGLRRAKTRRKGFGLALAAVIIGGVQSLGGFVLLVTMQLTGLGWTI